MAKTKADLTAAVSEILKAKEAGMVDNWPDSAVNLFDALTALVTLQEEELSLAKIDVEQAQQDKALAEEYSSSLGKINMKIQERVNQMEIDKRLRDSKEFNLNFTAIQGRVPVLWVKAISGQIDAGQFGKLRGAVMRQCPGVELMLLTNGNSELYELDEEDLNRMGLARIIGKLPEHAEPVAPALEFKPALPAPEDIGGQSK